MLQVVINFALVKGLCYKIDGLKFHQWTDQSQFYALRFDNKQDAQVFGNGVFTSLENLKTTGKAFKCCSNFLFIPHAVTSVSVKSCLNHKAENVLIKIRLKSYRYTTCLTRDNHEQRKYVVPELINYVDLGQKNLE